MRRERGPHSLRPPCARPGAGPTCRLPPSDPAGPAWGSVRVSAEGPGGAGGQSWSPRPGPPVSGAQVHTTLQERGWEGGSALRGWGPEQTTTSQSPCSWQSSQGLQESRVGTSKRPTPSPVPSHRQPPAGVGLPGIGPGSETGWRVRWEDRAPAPGQSSGTGTRGGRSFDIFSC